MKRVVNKAKDHKEAENWDIRQALNMTPEERQDVVKELKRRYYGTDTPDVRESRHFDKRKI